MKIYSGPELLESRIAPAGLINISIAGDVLKLVGDDLNNAVEVNVLTNGTVDLTPTGGTTLRFDGNNSTNVVNIPLVAPKLVVNLGAGNDILEISGNYRGLTLDLGAGTDLLTFDSTSASGDTKILGRDGDDNILTTPTASLRFYGKLTLDLGAGTDAALFNGFETSVTGPLTFSGGAGTDTFGSSSFTTIGGNFSMNFGAGTGIVSMDDSSSLRVLGKTTITSKAASGEAMFVELDPQFLTMQGGLSFSGGNGANTLSLTPTDKAEINSNIQMRSGSGPAIFKLQTPLVSIGGNVSVVSGGALAFTLVGPQTLSVEGNIVSRSGAGPNNTDLVGSGSVGGSLTIGSKTGGSADIFGPLYVAKKAVLDFKQATAQVMVTIASTIFANSVSITTGAANDSVSFNSGTIGGKLTISTGANTDTIGLESSGGFSGSTIGGAILLNAGSGNDAVTVGNTVSTPDLTAFSPIVLIGGTGTDSLLFAGIGNMILAGSTISGFESGS